MSIGKRICECIDLTAADDFEAALIPLSIAVDATASREYRGQPNNAAFKAFIGDNFPTISRISSGGAVSIGSLRVRFDHPKIKTASDGTCDVKELFYHAVRCGLVHEAQLPDNLRFHRPNMIKVGDAGVTLPAGLISGLAITVALAPKNESEAIPASYAFSFRGEWLRLCDWMGRREAFRELCEVDSRT